MAKRAEKKASKNTEGRMTIWEHLGELRRRLTVIIIALIVVTCGLYVVADTLIDYVVSPVLGLVPGNKLTVLDPLGGFTLRAIVAFFCAVVATSPLWIWQIMAFFLPALKPNERKWVLPTFFVAVLLFVFGVVFCYFFILEAAFAWMIDQTSAFADIIANARDFVGLILLFEVAFGFAFQLPLIVFYLIIFNVVPYKKLRKSWRVVYVVLLVFCAAVTPDVSPYTMFLMFIAMAVLYEASLLLSRIVLNKRIKAREAEQTQEEAEDDA